ncbi:MAG: transposase, partial [Candidatus Cloacimonadales bacterium]|nr:transposase [Candidatus Cloacimonadales bacterium]
MVTYSNMSFFEFQRKYNTEEACRDKLFQIRWSDGYVCPRCGNTTYYFHSTRKLYQC